MSHSGHGASLTCWAQGVVREHRGCQQEAFTSWALGVLATPSPHAANEVPLVHLSLTGSSTPGHQPALGSHPAAIRDAGH